MKLFGSKKDAETYGAIVDIGSGSVLVTIVKSNPHNDYPEILWAHREHPPLKNIDSLEQCVKTIMTALVNGSMLLDAKGREVLQRHNSKAKLTVMQCTIAAPWSYTITKKVHYKQEQSFTITDDLLDDLLTTAQTQITSELEANETLKELGLQTIDRMKMDMLANGYRVEHPKGGQAKQVTLAYSNAVSQQSLVDAVNEMHDKLLPGTKLSLTSYALAFYSAVRELFPDTYDTCLLDITYEATEMGVMRDGVLKYCTHTPFGLYSLVREIGAITKTPLVEIEKQLQADSLTSLIKSYPDSQQADIEQIFENFTKKIAELFKETGDDLSIPRHIILHTTRKTEKLFSEILTDAAKQTLKTAPTIQPITSSVLQKMHPELQKDTKNKPQHDTSMVLSAQFFHMKQQ